MRPGQGTIGHKDSSMESRMRICSIILAHVPTPTALRLAALPQGSCVSLLVENRTWNLLICIDPERIDAHYSVWSCRREFAGAIQYYRLDSYTPTAPAPSPRTPLQLDVVPTTFISLLQILTFAIPSYLAGGTEDESIVPLFAS